MSNVTQLKPRQINAVQLIALGTPDYQVAQRLEVSTMTLYRWKRLPAFEEKLRSISSSGLEEVAKKMNAATLTAIETLQESMCDLSVPSAMRIKVALGVLNVMPTINNALEKSLQHRSADFDLQKRWDGPAFSFDSSGSRIEDRGQHA
jgi:hypothetical protein